MATVSCNPSTIRTPTFQSHKSTSSFTSLPNPNKFSYKIFHLFKYSSRNHFHLNAVSGSSVSVPKESEIDDEKENPTKEISFLDPEVIPKSISDWELDFCSRPILDSRGKKIWELLVCDDSLSLQYTKFFPNNVINSITLKDTIVSITDELGIPIPRRVRFFRSQMQTIITKACDELSIKPIPSKRCISLLLWIEERYETVYTRHPGFQKGAKPLLAIDNPFPTSLPEHLFGEKWAFVQLPFSALKEEISWIGSKVMFGSSLDLDLLGIEIDDDALIPGLTVASSRAEALAGWMNSLEICSVDVDLGRGFLILSVGILKRYVYATFKKTNEARGEAEAWEAEKRRCGGLHFIAVQHDLESDDCAGFWLLLDMPPPPL